MTNEISIFNYETKNVRVITKDNKQYFCLSDTCKALEIKNTRDPLNYLDRDGVVKTDIIDTLGRKQETTFINEPNLYRLIFRSNKPQAQQFANWVYEEVLPSIRKTGSYYNSFVAKLPNELEKALINVDKNSNAFKSVWCNITKQERDLLEIVRIISAVRECAVKD